MFCDRKVGLEPNGEHFRRYCGGELTFALEQHPNQLGGEAFFHFRACRTCGEICRQVGSEWIVICDAAYPEVFA